MTGNENNKLSNSLKDICSRHLDESLDRALRYADAQLFDKLQYLPDNEQSEIGLAINLLESNTEWIVSNIESHIMERLFTLDQNDEPEDMEQAGAGLSLVAKDDFEDWLLVDVSKKKLERELGACLADLCIVFSEFCGAPEMREELVQKLLSVGQKIPVHVFQTLAFSLPILILCKLHLTDLHRFDRRPRGHR